MTHNYAEMLDNLQNITEKCAAQINKPATQHIYSFLQRFSQFTIDTAAVLNSEVCTDRHLVIFRAWTERSIETTKAGPDGIVSETLTKSAGYLQWQIAERMH